MAKRLLELEPTSLFGDEAILTQLSGTEELSRPFDFLLTIASTNEKIKPEQVIGQPLAVRIDRDNQSPRYIHGYVNSFWAGNTFAPENGNAVFRMYRVRIVPWLWFMSRASRCFIYHPEKAEKSIQDVLDAVVKRVKEYGHVVPELESGNAKILRSRKVEHCVQYRETDFNFLSRTLERYGIYYYFKFASDKHTLVLSDQLNYPNAPEAEVKYPNSADMNSSEDIITSWEHAYEFVTGKWEQTDYDFINPSTDLKVNAQKHGTITLNNNEAYELYDFPGEYVKKDDGQSEAAVRLEAEESRFNTVNGSSYCKSFSPGYCFKLTEHLNCKDEKGKAYLLTSVTHSASQPGPFTSDSQAATYTNSFVCIPKNSQYRPPRSTPQPLLSSVQTAVVVGPPGEEIYTDEYGRVKVQFHWDREGKRDENTSCWMRVSQAHAGRGFGGIDIPRVGEEVVVSFLEGDLDRPLITGRLYHKESMPPFTLPGEKTRSGLKTKTYKGSGFNEMSMDDTPGKEQIRIHGQYNMDTVVENDETHTIHNNRTKQIDVDETMTIGNNQKLDVGVNKTVSVGTNHTEDVGKNQTLTIGKNQSTSVGKNQSLNVGMMQDESVGIKASKNVGFLNSLSVGISHSVAVGVMMSTSVGDSIDETAGGSSSEKVGKKKTINAGEEVSIVCGAAKFVMKKDGSILLEGKDIVIKASGKITAKAGGDMVLKAAKIGQN